MTVQLLVRSLLAAFFIFAGRAHFTHPRPFCKIVPPPLPPLAFVYLSGVVEIVGGVALMLWPPMGAYLLIALLAAVFPANIYMALTGIKFGGFPPRPWMAWARLPLQPVLIYLVAWAGGVRL